VETTRPIDLLMAASALESASRFHPEGYVDWTALLSDYRRLHRVGICHIGDDQFPSVKTLASVHQTCTDWRNAVDLISYRVLVPGTSTPF